MKKRTLTIVLILALLLAAAPLALGESESLTLCDRFISGDLSLRLFFVNLNKAEDLASKTEEVEKRLSEAGKLEEFRNLCAGISAYHDMNKTDSKLMEYVQAGRITLSRELTDIDAYFGGMQDLSPAMEGWMYQANQAAPVPPTLWTEDDLQAYLGKSIDQYTPTNPQPLTCLVVIEPNSMMGKDRDDIRSYTERSVTELSTQADKIIQAIATFSGDKIKFTGDPDQASIILKYSVTYPFAGNYGTSVKAYGCEVAVKAIDAKTHKEIAKVVEGAYPGTTISVRSGSTKWWKNLPSLNDSTKIETFSSTVAESGR